MRALLLALVGAALLAIAPNALWLSRSAALVRSHSVEPVSLSIIAGDEDRRVADLGALDASDVRFVWIEARGEANLLVEILHRGERSRHCDEYVEDAMYHVEIVIDAPHEVICRVELPLFDRLLLLAVLRAQL